VDITSALAFAGGHAAAAPSTADKLAASRAEPFGRDSQALRDCQGAKDWSGIGLSGARRVIGSERAVSKHPSPDMVRQRKNCEPLFLS
jgi:hypothetical protein